MKNGRGDNVRTERLEVASLNLFEHKERKADDCGQPAGNDGMYVWFT